MNTRELVTIAVTCATVILSVAAAVAVWKIATGVQWMLIILSIGASGEMLFVGAGVFCRHRLAGRAMLEEAKGKAQAAISEGKATVIASRRAQPPTERKRRGA